MTPAERAARALWALDTNQSDAMAQGDVPWQDYLPQVRTVLEMVHEPSEWMKEAGAEVVRYVGSDGTDFGYRQDAANIWRYMIDAMIKDVS
ncbi:hypothetical protein PMI04_007575 [Sphingobium sp. AP49]|uniref:hypothetical protein n=1 Tax=Sphingobium sp. AP49 TaxID=1144307 RepID=UPI00026ED135|nr:hypothetical protein [Sphingobium sp. AP49]WHO40445.1 hypothetical protein PMI04_007575 [Sphingobium sp. AP49]